jgi:hypothetical protein
MTAARPARKRPPLAREGSAPSVVTPGGEGGWSSRSPVFIGLGAVVMAVPLLVLGPAAGPYDDPKAWALPIVVAGTALGWLARPRAPLARAAGDGPTRVLRWTIALSLVWGLITTVTSIAPGQSVVGNFGRGMGLLTVSAAALVFFLVRSECRTPEAIRALLDAALLGSVPVCLLALGQAIGWDPLPRAWDPAVATLTVRSTFGQHIFLGSYLVVLVPLAAARLDATFRRWWSPEAGGDRRRVPLRALGLGTLWVAGALGLVVLAARWAPAWWALGPWGIVGALTWAVAREPGRDRSRGSVGVVLLAALVAAQVLVVVLSGARGPLLGMLFGLSVAGLTLLARRRAWKAVVVTAAAVAALLAGLVLLNVPNSPLAPLARVGVLSRLSELTNVTRGTPVWFRLQVWGGILSGWGRQLRGEEIIPGTWPRARSALGYGLETQLLTLDQLALPALGVTGASGEGWRAQYLVDRAHNLLLDHLVTGGLIEVGLWLALIASLLAVGISRARTALPGEETTLRLGCLGAVLAHLAEGQVGIVTTMPLALFWMTSGLIASAPWCGAGAPPGAGSRTPRPGRTWWTMAMVVLALAAALIAWVNTRWLLGSIAYAEGARRLIAGQRLEAYADFRRSTELMPWVSLPAEAFAYTALRLAGNEPSAVSRLGLLHEGEAALAESRRHARGSAASWTLTAQLMFAESRAGERSKLAMSLEAFAAAARLRPEDPQLMAQWGWAWLEHGDPERARQAAERAVALSGGRSEWLPWAVLARAARVLGDAAQERRAADMARSLAPPEASRLLESFLP